MSGQKFTKGPLVIRFAQGRTYDVSFLQLPPYSRIFYPWFSFHDMQIVPFVFLLLVSIITQLGSALSSLYSHTTKSIHYFVWVTAKFNSQLLNFCKYVNFVFHLLHFKPSLNKCTLFSSVSSFLLMKILNCIRVVSRVTCINNRFC